MNYQLNSKIKQLGWGWKETRRFEEDSLLLEEKEGVKAAIGVDNQGHLV